MEEPDLENQLEAEERTNGQLDYIRIKGGEASCAILPKACYKRELGRGYVCLEHADDDGRPRVLWMVGACWPMMLCTLTLLSVIPLTVFSYSYQRVGNGLIVIGFFGLFVTIVSFTSTACSDPGIFPRYRTRPVDVKNAETWRYNSVTMSYRPPGVVYCRDNAMLVEKIDHFCPWTGTTIAKRNLCCFHIFTSSLCALLIFNLVLFMIAGSADLHSGGFTEQ